MRSEPLPEEQNEILQILSAIKRLSRGAVSLIMSECQNILNDDYVPHSDNNFVFMLPRGAIRTTPAKWTNLRDPPFLNRQQTMLQLLSDCFANATGIGLMKPNAAVIAASSGYGKTRLLLEWAIRVFHDPEVMQAFIENSTLPLPAHKSFETIAEEIKNGAFDANLSKNQQQRLRFLSSLHETLKKSLIISASIAELDVAPAVLTNLQDEQQAFLLTDLICRRIVISNICSRFAGKHKINTTEVDIPITWNPDKDEDKEWLISNELLKTAPNKENYSVFFSLLDLFVHLVYNDRSYVAIGLSLDSKILLVNIDEASLLLETSASDKLLAYRVMVHFYDYQLLYCNKVKVHMLMAGKYTTNLNKLQEPAKIMTNISLPLTPLSQESCMTICQQIINEPLTKSAQALVHALWKKSMGIPRAIQLLHETLQQFKETLKMDTIPVDMLNKIIKKFAEDAKELCSLDVSVDSNQFGLEQNALERREKQPNSNQNNKRKAHTQDEIDELRTKKPKVSK